MLTLKMTRMLIAAAAFIAVSMSSVFAIAGIGVHYGIDMSLSMDDVKHEQASLGELKLDVSKFAGPVPSGYKPTLSGVDLPIYIDRSGWERHPFNIGGKIYIDFIPFIDAIELSGNYGVWQYDGSIIYPTAITFKANPGTVTADSKITDIADLQYDTTLVTLKDLGLDNPFVKRTPYSKLQLDLTIRKNILKLPPIVNIIKIYGGAGASVFFATPILSAGFISKTLGTSLSTVTDVNNLQSALFDQQSDAMKKLGQQFLKDLMTPHYGAHIDVGAALKFPIIPIGLYVDGKFLIPFGDMDESVKLSATGLLVNAGLSFGL